MWEGASLEERNLDPVQAILTVLGYSANQGGKATWMRVGVQGPGQESMESVLGLVLELEFELVQVVAEAGTGDRASKADRADRAALELERGLEQEPGQGRWVWLVQGWVLQQELELAWKLEKGQCMELVVSQASRVCWADRASRVSAGRAVPARKGRRVMMEAGSARGC